MSGERLCLGARVEVNLAKDISVIAAIGLNAAKQLFLETEETVLLISKRGSILARNRMAVKLLQSGYSRKQTAQAIGLTERGLSRAIAEPSDNLA